MKCLTDKYMFGMFENEWRPFTFNRQNKNTVVPQQPLGRAIDSEGFNKMQAEY